MIPVLYYIPAYLRWCIRCVPRAVLLFIINKTKYPIQDRASSCTLCFYEQYIKQQSGGVQTGAGSRVLQQKIMRRVLQINCHIMIMRPRALQGARAKIKLNMKRKINGEFSEPPPPPLYSHLQHKKTYVRKHRHIKK